MIPIGISLSLIAVSRNVVEFTEFLEFPLIILVFITPIAAFVSVISIFVLLLRHLDNIRRIIIDAVAKAKLGSINEKSFEVPYARLLGLIIIVGGGVGLGTITGLIFTFAGVSTELLFAILGYTVGAILAGIFLGAINSTIDQFNGSGYVVSAFFCSLLCLPLGLPWNIISTIAITPFVAMLLGSKVNKLIFAPTVENIMRFILSLNADWPFYDMRFLDFVTEALILRKSGQGYEFVHRLLRDHFVEVAMNSKQSGNAIWRGQVYFEIGDYPKALTELNNALKQAPGNKKLFAKRGETYMLLGSLESALFDYNQVISTNAIEDKTGDIANLLNRARIYIRQHETAKASEDIERAIKIDSQNQAALSMREEVKSQTQHD